MGNDLKITADETIVEFVADEDVIELSPDETKLEISADETVIELVPEEKEVIVVEVCEQGPPGKDADTPTYTGTAERTVGGISDGQPFNNADMQEMWDALIKQEKFPTLTNPSSSFNASITGYREIGEVVNIDFNASFSMGSINPQYTATSPYRSGLPNQYNYTGFGLTDNSSTSLTDAQSITNYTVVANGQSWACSVSYDAGVQPKSSYDNDYDSSLPVGTTSTHTQTIIGVYPYLATTTAINVMDTQALTSMSSAYVQIDLVAESGTDKQTIDFPVAWSTITGIEFYNTISSAWEWLGGSKANSLLLWDQSSVVHTIQGNAVSYTRFVNNGSLIGARQTRWHTD